jgi:hypothetical protein
LAIAPLAYSATRISPAATRAARLSFVRVPFADKTHIKVPTDGLTDEQVLFSPRHLPDRLAGGRAMRHPAYRHGCDLGLRRGRPDDHPQRRAARGQAGGLRSTAFSGLAAKLGELIEKIQ